MQAPTTQAIALKDILIVMGQQEILFLDTGTSTNDGMANVPVLRGSGHSEDALHMRDNLMEYTNSNLGLLSWQLDYVRHT